MMAAAALMGFFVGVIITSAILWWQRQRLRRSSIVTPEAPLLLPARAANASPATDVKASVPMELHGSEIEPRDSDRRSLIDVCVWTIMSTNSIAVRQQLVDTLARVGVELYKADGLPFDVSRHYAIGWEQAPSPLLHRHVARTVRPGVRDGDIVIRPAEVVVYRKVKRRGNGVTKSQGT